MFNNTEHTEEKELNLFYFWIGCAIVALIIGIVTDFR